MYREKQVRVVQLRWFNQGFALFSINYSGSVVTTPERLNCVNPPPTFLFVRVALILSRTLFSAVCAETLCPMHNHTLCCESVSLELHRIQMNLENWSVNQTSVKRPPPSSDSFSPSQGEFFCDWYPLFRFILKLRWRKIQLDIDRDDWLSTSNAASVAC